MNHEGGKGRKTGGEKEGREAKEVEVVEILVVATRGLWGPLWLHVIYERKIIRKRESGGGKVNERGKGSREVARGPLTTAIATRGPLVVRYGHHMV